MRNRIEIQQRPGRRNDGQELNERLDRAKRLCAADKAVFAKNLGELAARISPGSSLEGAKRIVMQSGLQGLWPTKRKRFFRLPEEESTNPSKEGDYASSPLSFRKLAEAAGELLNKSNRQEDVERWRAFAIKRLVTGSTFMPSFVPSGVSGQSAKQLLDEYASVLAEAVKSRTRITELWAILENTPIGLVVDQENVSPYGEAAEFPPTLLTPLYSDFITRGHFITGPALSSDVDWSIPRLKIGYLKFSVYIWMYRIPEEKRHFFTVPPGTGQTSERLPNEALHCMEELGFDLEDRAFPSENPGDEGSPWTIAKADIFVKVGLEVTRDGDGEIAVQISLWGDMNYAVYFNPEAHIANVNNILRDEGLCQARGFNNKEVDEIVFIYDKVAELDELKVNPPIGILPNGWYWDELLEWEAPEIFPHERSADICKILASDLFVPGWTDEEFIARVLMGEDAEFHPIIPESSPIGGVLPAGSIGAALLQNARFASPNNRITQLLIDKAALTAEAGLRFYDAMVDDFRSAIHRI
jgi:hypothetical protein